MTAAHSRSPSLSGKGESTRRESRRRSSRKSSTGTSLATLLIKDRTRINLPSERAIHTKRDPAQHSVRPLITHINIVHKRVAGLRGLAEQEILLVGRQGLRVGDVGRVALHGRDERLVKVNLADVRGRRGMDGAVGVCLSVGVHHDVDVRGPAHVVAWEEGVERDGAVVVGHLETAEEGRIPVGLIAVAVAVDGDARVDAGGVAVCQKC